MSSKKGQLNAANTKSIIKKVKTNPSVFIIGVIGTLFTILAASGSASGPLRRH